jgi:hypothetical protein
MSFFPNLIFQKETRIKLNVSPEECVEKFKQFTHEWKNRHRVILTSEKECFEIQQLSIRYNRYSRFGKEEERYVAKVRIVRNTLSNELVLNFGEADLDGLVLLVIVLVFSVLNAILIFIGNYRVASGILLAGIIAYAWKIFIFSSESYDATKWVKENILNDFQI